MIEVREDVISKRKVIINETRSQRPRKKDVSSSSCIFCPGSETKTPPEIDRFEKKKKWSIRVFPNKYPVLSLQRYTVLKKDFLKSWKGHGSNEIIVLTPDHKASPLSFSSNKWFEVLKMYKKRVEYNYSLQGIKYVLVYHNQGSKGGATISHTHSQLLSFPFVPNIILNEVNSFSKKLCCKMIDLELKNNRLVFKNKDFIVFCNFASRFAFETHIYSLNHYSSITDLSDELLHSLSEVMSNLMKAYKKSFDEMDFNFVLHNSPKGENYHFHIEVYPHFNKLAGVEHGVNVNINSISPERAAKVLGGKLR